MNKLRLANFLPLLILLSALALPACGSDYLRSDSYRANEEGFKLDKDSKIPDTPEDRAILDVLARYRSALVKKDVGTIKNLISSNYYENAGTTDTTADDYGAKQLPPVYELLSKYTDDIRYNITIKDLHIEGKNASVDYEYQYAYHYFVDGKPSWDAGVEVNQVKLEKVGDAWKIVSGL